MDELENETQPRMTQRTEGLVKSTANKSSVSTGSNPAVIRNTSKAEKRESCCELLKENGAFKPCPSSNPLNDFEPVNIQQSQSYIGTLKLDRAHRDDETCDKLSLEITPPARILIAQI